MKLKRHFLVFCLIVISFFIFNPIEVNAEINGCVYEVKGSGSEKLIINASKSVFKLSADGKLEEKSLGTVNIAGTEKADGNFAAPFKSCPGNLYKYELGASGGARGDAKSVYSVSLCEIETVNDINDDFRKRCDFLFDYIYIKPVIGGTEKEEMTLRESIEEYGEMAGALFKYDSLKKQYQIKDLYKAISITEAQEDAAKENMEAAATAFASCVKKNHPYVSNCNENEYDEYVSCVMAAVEAKGDEFKCSAEKNQYEEASKELTTARELKLIEWNLKELSCEEILGTDLIEFLKRLFFYIMIIGIGITVVMTMLDYGKAIASSDEEIYKKANKKMGRRIIILIILILLPVLIEYILIIFGGAIGITNAHPFCE